MLCLRQEIGGNPAHVHRAVGQDGDLARTRNLVDRNISVHLALRGCDERISGAGNLLDLAARFGSEGHHADSLDSSNAVDLCRARELEGVEKNGVDLSCLACGRTCDDLPDARRLCERHCHNRR